MIRYLQIVLSGNPASLLVRRLGGLAAVFAINPA